MEATTRTEALLPRFSVGMEIPYDLRFLSLVLKGMAGFAGLAGCVRRESEALRLALEETLAFLICSYPDAEVWERIHLESLLQADGVAAIAITNLLNTSRNIAVVFITRCWRRNRRRRCLEPWRAGGALAPSLRQQKGGLDVHFPP